MVIVHGVPSSFRNEAALLYEDAFGPKFSVAIGSKQKRLALLGESLNLNFAFAAIDDNKLVGLAGYSTSKGSLTDRMTYSLLLKHAGWLTGNWAALVFSLYERPKTDCQLLMDGIAVDAARRGEGIGSTLLDTLSHFATEQGFKSVRLDVIDTNLLAKKMYERNGFKQTKAESFKYLRWLLGFGGSFTLERDLNIAD